MLCASEPGILGDANFLVRTRPKRALIGGSYGRSKRSVDSSDYNRPDG
jgi:hypothetical protein